MTMDAFPYCILCYRNEVDPPQRVCFMNNVESARSLAKQIANVVREKLYVVARYEKSTCSFRDYEVINPDLMM